MKESDKSQQLKAIRKEPASWTIRKLVNQDGKPILGSDGWFCVILSKARLIWQAAVVEASQ